MSNHHIAPRGVIFPAQARILSLAAVMLGASLLASCAGNNAQLDSAAAQSAGDKGNWASETALAEKAYREDPDLLNEFNLATGYERTGQNAKATALYQDVVVKGKSTTMDANRPDGDSPAAITDANMSDEAGRRIELMAGRPSEVVPDQESYY